MNQKEILLVKIDTLKQSISDSLIDTVLSLLKEVVETIDTTHGEIGFKTNKK